MATDPSTDDNTIPLHHASVDDEERSLRERYDRFALRLFGDFFKRYRETFSDFQTSLNQARLSDGYDLYLSRLVLTTLVLAVVALGIAAGVTFSIFFDLPFTIPLPTTSAPGLPVGGPIVPAGVTESLNAIGPVVFGLVLGVLLLGILSGTTVVALYVRPWYRAGEREREIDTMLPYAITFMYALSRGGANLINVMKTMGNSDDVYGEVANEFQMVVRNIEFFDSDLRGALRYAGVTSPSTQFAEFTDDLISVVDTGGNVGEFLFNKTEEYLQRAQREQENFLETLSLMGEIYVTAFVAGPLFVIIIVTVMALIGGSNLTMLYAIVYGLLPMGNLGFAFLIDVLQSGKDARSTLRDHTENVTLDSLEERIETTDDVDNRIENLYDVKKRHQTYDVFRHPMQTLREQPAYTLAVTIPIALAFIVVMLFTYPLPATMEAFYTDSIVISTVFFVGPLLFVLTPLSIFHEMKVRRKRRILNKLPGMLRKLSSANATGMSLAESFDVVADSAGGELGDQLRYVRSEIGWRHNVNEALSRFARRIDTPRLSRTVKLITKANMSTGNITDVLDVATKDVAQTHRLEEDRKNEMSMYTVIIIVSFLVYLLVVVMLNEAFLGRIAELGAEQPNGSSGVGAAGGGMGFSLSDMPVNTYNMVFYHSTVIQGLGAGLIAGQMGADDLLSGLKYGIALVCISTATFLIL